MRRNAVTHEISRRDFCRAAGLALAAIPLASSPALGNPAHRVAGPMIAPAQGATPAVTAAPASGGLAEMLAMVPALLPRVENTVHPAIMYADIARQMEVTGTPIPASMDDPAFAQWIAAAQSLNLPGSAANSLRDWRDDYGFDLLQADQTLELSGPPFTLTLFRGRFDQDAVRATLTGNGYREIEVDGYTLLSLRDDLEQDLGSPLADRMAGMNHVALLEDGSIAASSVKAALAGVLDVVAGNAPSMMEQASIAMPVEQTPADLVSAMMESGTMLAGEIPASLIELDAEATPDISAIATEVAGTSEMPPVVRVLLGATAGSSQIDRDSDVPDAGAVAVVLMLTPEAANAAVPVVEERLATGTVGSTGKLWQEYFPAFNVEAVASMPLLVIDFTLAPAVSPNILTQMLINRDLGFLAW